MNSVYFHNILKRKVLLSHHKSISITGFIIAIFLSAFNLHAQQLQNEVDTAIFLREARELQELLVNPKNYPYSKDNPAVRLVNHIRSNQKKGDPRLLPYYSYDKYDKMTLGLLDVSDEDLRQKPELKNYLDTTPDGSRDMLKVLLNEKASTVLYSSGGKDQKEVLRGSTSYGVNEMFDVGNVDIVLQDLLREVDIYNNDITLMANRFPSPLSSAGNVHYRYFIADTIDVEGIRCIQLTFMPRNPADFSFSGNLYVEEGDTTGFIRKVSMKVPRTVNLNFVDNIFIEQLFEKDANGRRHKHSDKVYLDICLMKGTQRLSASRSTRYENFSDKIRTDLRTAYDAVGQYIEIGNPSDSNGDLLTYMRRNDLTKAEENMSSLMGDLRKYPFFYWAEKALVVLVTGYIKTGKQSKFDFGPINTLVSSNPIEGIRLRLGGMTTANLSPNWFANGYVSYGTRDRKWKYKGQLEYSLYKKRYHSREFPVNSIRLTHMYDLDMIGQHYLFTSPDNVFLSLKRKKDLLATYRHFSQIEYILELRNGFSFSVWGQHIKQDASQELPFINGDGQSIPFYRRSTIGASVRYAPGEKFIQENDVRLAVNKDAPIIQMLMEWGPKLIGVSHYSICKTEISVWKRFWFSSFGYLDALAKGGVIWSQVPYTELLWPNANLSYTIQPESYSLLNPMEFAMDRFVSCDLTYWGNGVLFNRIPLVKKAKLREIVEFKYLWGGLSKRNNPEHHPELYRFPENADVSIMKTTPYMELSVGLDNILKIFRIDYVWRLTYLDTPGIDRSGIRVGLHFKF